MIERRLVPKRDKTATYTTADGRKVRGCRDLGCYSATLGAFCVEHAKTLKPERIGR